MQLIDCRRLLVPVQLEGDPQYLRPVPVVCMHGLQSPLGTSAPQLPQESVLRAAGIRTSRRTRTGRSRPRTMRSCWSTAPRAWSRRRASCSRSCACGARPAAARQACMQADAARNQREPVPSAQPRQSACAARHCTCSVGAGDAGCGHWRCRRCAALLAWCTAESAAHTCHACGWPCSWGKRRRTAGRPLCARALADAAAARCAGSCQSSPL